MPNITKQTLITIARIVIPILALGLLVGLTSNATMGLLLISLLQFACLAYHIWKLVQLDIWLDNPRASSIPDGVGRWSDVLTKLSRRIRQERLNRHALVDGLAQFQKAALALPYGATMLDTKHNIVWCNPTAEMHWGISLVRDQMQTITYIIRHPEFIAYLNGQNHHEPLKLKISRSAENAALQECTLAVKIVRVSEERILLLSQDVSERERLETIRRDFVANVSHELRTPLTVMAGFLETMDIAGNASTELNHKALTHLRNQTVRMQQLVDDLLTLSRLEDEHNKLHEAAIDIPALITALIQEAEQLSRGQHRIVASLGKDWLQGSLSEITSAFGNLINNAIRYTPAGSEIRVSWQQKENQLAFKVSDNGEGIAPEHIPRLTERFYRVDRGRSRASGGTGLGLAIVKHVLMRHGAKLDISSSQDIEQHGAAFTALFPINRQISPPVEVSELTPLQGTVS